MIETEEKEVEEFTFEGLIEKGRERCGEGDWEGSLEYYSKALEYARKDLPASISGFPVNVRMH